MTPEAGRRMRTPAAENQNRKAGAEANAHRRTAIVVGVLYIVGTVAGAMSMVVTRGLLGPAGDLQMVAAHPSRAQAAALLVVVMGVALAMVPAMMFPLLKRQNEALAIGYVIFRGALETFTCIAVALCWLLVVVVAQQGADSGAAAAAEFGGLGVLLVEAKAVPILAVQDIMFGLGGLMFYGLLYQARLIPRWLSGWGIAGVLLYLVAGLIALFGTHLVPLPLPLAVQETVIAICLIAKGSSPRGIAAQSDRQLRAA